MTDTIPLEAPAHAGTIGTLLRSMDDGRADEAERIVRKEYGESENFMTPNAVGCIMLADGYAAEISLGTGLRREDGTRPTLVGISIVREYENGDTDRQTMASGCLVAPTIEEVRDSIRDLQDGYSQRNERRN